MNLDKLLRPLEGETPCGSDMMFSAEFDEIAEARRFDDPSLAQGEWIAERKESDWSRVIKICEELLSRRTKDIRVAAWMVEALTNIRGLAGMAEGFSLLNGLCETFWLNLYPQAEDGDMEPRIGNLEWLANRSYRLVREVALTCSPKGNFSTIDLESARALAQAKERNPGSSDESGRDARVSLVQFDAARQDTDLLHFINGQRDAERACSEVRALQTLLDRLIGPESPSFRATLEALDDILHRMKRYAAEAGAEDGAPGPARTADDRNHTPMLVLDGDVAGGMAIHSRAQAIRQLREIADFFRRSEPHSPVAYLADKAARWGDMSLHEWLRTVVKDDGALLRVEELLGVESGIPESDA